MTQMELGRPGTPDHDGEDEGDEVMPSTSSQPPAMAGADLEELDDLEDAFRRGDRRRGRG